MTGRPSLYEALHSRIKDGQAAAEERTAPERDAFTAQLKADAALYGTAAWDRLPDARKARVAEYVRQAQAGQDGGDDAA